MKSPILLYDGYCALCNFFVRLVLRFDKKQIIFFAPLHSEIAKEIRMKFQLEPNLDSIFFFDGQNVLTHHKAVFSILKLLPYPIRFFLIFQLLPGKLSKALYNFIAKRRYHLFGKLDSCPLPEEKDRMRFL